MDPAKGAKQYVIQIYEHLLSQETSIQKLEIALAALLKTVNELNGHAAETYARHFEAEEKSPLVQPRAEMLKAISGEIGKLKATLN